jgi:hypothetical protein
LKIVARYDLRVPLVYYTNIVAITCLIAVAVTQCIHFPKTTKCHAAKGPILIN